RHASNADRHLVRACWTEPRHRLRANLRVVLGTRDSRWPWGNDRYVAPARVESAYRRRPRLHDADPARLWQTAWRDVVARGRAGACHKGDSLAGFARLDFGRYTPPNLFRRVTPYACIDGWLLRDDADPCRGVHHLGVFPRH